MTHNVIFRLSIDSPVIARNNYVSSKIETTSFYCYQNWYSISKIISPTSRSLVYYFNEVMDETSNEFFQKRHGLKQYHAFRVYCGIKRVSNELISNAFDDLLKMGIIINTPVLDIYILNPLYLFKSTEPNRQSLIRKLVAHSNDPEWGNSNLNKALNPSDNTSCNML